MNWTAHEEIKAGDSCVQVKGLRCLCFAKSKDGGEVGIAASDFAKGEPAKLLTNESTGQVEFVKIEKS